MNTKEKVRNILIELSGVEFWDDYTMIQHDLAMDSLSMITMLLEIEDAFQIRLDQEDMNPYYLETVQDVINMVNRYVGDLND